MGGAEKHGADTAHHRVGLRDVLRNRTFAVLYGAETQSIAGDQLARVALSVLVFERTNSATATAATYAATYLPAILGGWLLGRLGDRYPRRAVMIVCDVARALLFAAMTLSGLPMPAIAGLLVVAVFLGPAFSASEVSYLATVLDEPKFRVATGLRMVTSQAAQVAGFAVGGVLVAALHPRGALLVDAGTYLLSAVAVAALRSAPSSRAGAKPPVCVVNGARAQEADRPHRLRRDRRLVAMAGLSALAGFFIVPEGLAVPFGTRLGATTAQIGLLLAALPLGGAVGAALLVRAVRPERRLHVAGWMAIGCGLPLLVPAFVAHWPVALVCWMISGALAAYQVEVITSLVHRIPDVRRSQILGFVSASLLGAQGVGVLLFGLVAREVSVATSIAIAGLTGSALAVALALQLWRSGRDTATEGPSTAKPIPLHVPAGQRPSNSNGGRARQDLPGGRRVVTQEYRPRSNRVAYDDPANASQGC